MPDNPSPCKEKEDKLSCHECFSINLTRSCRIIIFAFDCSTLKKKSSPEARELNNTTFLVKHYENLHKALSKSKKNFPKFSKWNVK